MVLFSSTKGLISVIILDNSLQDSRNESNNDDYLFAMEFNRQCRVGLCRIKSNQSSCVIIN